MRTNNIKPSKWYYGLAILVIVLGNLAAIFVFLSTFTAFERSRHHIIVPGEHLVELSAPGSYTIFYEYRSVVGNRIFSTDSEIIPDLKCLLTDQSSIEINLVPRLGNERYSSLNGAAGLSLFNFKIHKGGRYTVKANYEDGRKKPEVVLAIIEGFTESAFRTIGIIGLVLISTIGLAGYIGYTIFAKRRRYRKAITCD